MTEYSLMRHDPSGETYAMRHNEYGHITGYCGPLQSDEQDAPGDDYHYNDEDDWEETLDWFNAIGTDLYPNEALAHIRDLPPAKEAP